MSTESRSNGNIVVNTLWMVVLYGGDNDITFKCALGHPK